MRRGCCSIVDVMVEFQIAGGIWSLLTWGKTNLTRGHVGRRSTATATIILINQPPISSLTGATLNSQTRWSCILHLGTSQTSTGARLLAIATMYELFLTALIEGVDLDPACAILSGVCGMQPWHSTERVLFFQGPYRPSGLANLNSLGPSIRDRNNRKVHQFKELHQKLSKESFVLQTRYDVSKDTQMGPEAAAMDLNSTPGILRWTDFPDPPHNRPHLTSRGKVEIWDQPGLMAMMADNQFT